MGRIDLSKLSGFSGKIGPIIAYVTRDGKQVFRTYSKPRNPKTPKQQANRARFALVNKELSPLLIAIKRGYPDIHNAYRTLIGKACREAVAGEYPRFYIDFSKIQIAAGPLQLPSDANVRIDPVARAATFTWDTRLSLPLARGSDNDKVYIVCFNNGKPAEARTLHGGTRASGKAIIELPKEWQPASTHFWLYLGSFDLRHNSNSMYLKLE